LRHGQVLPRELRSANPLEKGMLRSDEEPIMSEFLWLLTVAGGPVLLAVLIFWAVRRRRQLSAGEERAQHEAVDRLYDERK
jgi:hypothetical protein